MFNTLVLLTSYFGPMRGSCIAHYACDVEFQSDMLRNVTTPLLYMGTVLTAVKITIFG